MNINNTKVVNSIVKLNTTIFKRLVPYEQIGSIPGIEGYLNVLKLISLIHHINKGGKIYHFDRCRKRIW